MSFFRKIRSLFRKGKIDVDMADEMQAHVDLQTEQNIAAGMNPDEARYRALRKFDFTGLRKLLILRETISVSA